MHLAVITNSQCRVEWLCVLVVITNTISNRLFNVDNISMPMFSLNIALRLNVFLLSILL